MLVRRLRRKVDEVGGDYTYIQTLHGVGYRFLTTPRRMPGAFADGTLQESRPGDPMSLA